MNSAHSVQPVRETEILLIQSFVHSSPEIQLKPQYAKLPYYNKKDVEIAERSNRKVQMGAMNFETIAGVLLRLQEAQQTSMRRSMATEKRTMTVPSMSRGSTSSVKSKSFKERRTDTMSSGRANAFINRCPIVRHVPLLDSRSYIAHQTASTPVGQNSFAHATSSRTAEFEREMRRSQENPLQSELLKSAPDEPNLYQLPSAVYPEYRPLPLLLKLLLGFVASVTSVKMHSYHIAQILALIKNPLRSKSMKMILTLIATFFFSTTLVQDLFYQPSRISTSTLLNNKWLPSPLSRFSIVSTSIPPQLQTHLDENDLDLKMDPIGVHFLEYNNDLSSTPSNDFHFDAIHFNHGFGASSLSWLPAIPSLVNKLGGKIGIAHDAPGFGFTDRPSATGRKGGLVPFSSAGSAALGNALLSSRLSKENDAEGETNGQRIALFGHSMGCASTLKMALALDADVEKIVVLVAPALVGEFPDRRKKRKKEAATEENAATRSSRTIESSQLFLVRRWVSLLLAALRRVFLDPFIMYVLRRAVG